MTREHEYRVPMRGRNKKQQLQNNTSCQPNSKLKNTCLSDIGELRGGATAVRTSSRGRLSKASRQCGGVVEGVKETENKDKVVTRPVSQEDVPLPEDLSTRILSAVYKEDIFEGMVYLAAFKARFQDQMEKPKRRLVLEEYTKMLWHQAI